MDIKLNRRVFFIIFLIFLLSGCNSLNSKPSEQTESENNVSGLDEVAEIEAQAMEAYVNKNWTLAEKHYSELIKLLPNESESWFRLGNIYARTNRHSAAINAYRQSLALNSSNTKAWNNLGIVQLREATNTFALMQQHLQQDDPLYRRTDEVIEAMTNLLEKGFSVNPDNDPGQSLKIDSELAQ